MRVINISAFEAQWVASCGLCQGGEMSHLRSTENLKIVSLDVKDLRFPTSLHADGSDAMFTRGYKQEL
ncbi:hypothetical protein NQ315_011904 [Exocentrus adspersus]|uniref:Uncharacterized protein n=1 Tax=Exocentrus adspersus TaxID=1586481 RepID=A0AAV8W0W0_9CUCU|nr:hypothetical protein NQ315_011904 [Exocentrus adspersus]